MRTGLPLLATLLVLAGCSGSPAPAPPPTTGVDRGNLTAASVLGDLREVSLCDYIQAPDLAPAGTARMIGPESFEGCAFRVARADGAEVELVIGPLDTSEAVSAEDLPRRKLTGGLSLATASDEKDECLQYLVFPDDVVLGLSSTNHKGSSGDLCAVNAVAAEFLPGSLAGGKKAKRGLRDNSLARVAACDVVPKSVDLPGVGSDWKQTASGHTCAMSGTSGGVEFHMGAGGAPLDNDTTTDRRDIAGRTTVYDVGPQPYRDSGWYCRTSFVHVPSYVKGLDAAREFASITVSGPERSDRLCSVALDLAAQVWPRLPEI